jgi:hypothetical protein
VDVILEWRAGELVVRGDHGTGDSSGSGGGCRVAAVVLPALEAIPIAEGVFDDAVAVQIRCGTAVVDERWVGTGDIVDIDAEARVQAQRYVETVLGPRLSLGTSPPANILVGLDTWFWLDGWDGAPIATTVTAPWGDAIDLELALERVVWNFGDGTSPTSGDLGLPYPAESTVRHVYTHRSTSRGNPDGAYRLEAQVRINVRYWYDGDGPFTVAPLQHAHAAPVIVRQLQAVIG